jgi:chromosome partitioning protein
MILTIASYKGGVCKTTTAVHLAAFLNEAAPTVLFDADPTKNATAWSQRRAQESLFPFRVAPSEASVRIAKDFEHKVIDSGQRPKEDELKLAVENSDLLVIPAVPSALDVDGLQQTLQALRRIGAQNYRVLITKVSPDMRPAAAELRQLLEAFGAPVFVSQIPRLKAFEKAAETGVVVSEVKDPMADRAWRAYEAAGEELGL